MDTCRRNARRGQTLNSQAGRDLAPVEGLNGQSAEKDLSFNDNADGKSGCGKK